VSFIETSKMIEAYLLRHAGWIPAATIVQEFGLGDGRALRAAGDKPGLCTAFAISGARGLRHVRCCTQAEFDAFYTRMRKHGIGELVRARKLLRARGKVVRDNASVVDGQVIASEVVPTVEEVAA
jgi:hypothetical protein